MGLYREGEFMKIFVYLILLATCACSGANFSASNPLGKASASPAASNPDSSTQTATSTTVEQNSQPVDGQAQDDSTANPPVMVGGAYLVCSRETDIYCRLNNADSSKFSFSSEPATTVTAILYGTSAEKPASFIWQLPASDWHWKLQAASFAAADVQQLNLHIAGQTGRQADFVATFTQHPMEIGDGSSVQGGCTWATTNPAELGGLTYSRDVTLAQDQNKINVFVHNLCGIVRASDGTINLLSGGAVIKKYYLPVTSAMGDYTWSFTGLSAGTYTIKMIPGNKIDIDDFEFYGMSISF